MISMFLAEIKECLLEIASSGEEALSKMPKFKPDVVLYAHGLQGKNTIEVLKEIHRHDPGAYLIVSAHTPREDLLNLLMLAGASDCIPKGKNYVVDLVQGVKKAFIRIAERQTFALPYMAKAECFAMDENLPDLILTLDLVGNFLYANKAITSLLGYEARDVIGNSFLDYLAEGSSRKNFEDYLAHLEQEIHFRGEAGLITSLGIDEEFEINFTLMEGEHIYGVIKKANRSGKDYMEIRTQAEEEGIALENEEIIPPRLGQYRIVTLLGTGGMARVYKGFDEQLERNVAIKVLSKQFVSDQGQLERFHQEAKILASICHPNIGMIYHFGSSATELRFFCMEYLPGGSLDYQLRLKGTFDPETAVSYTIQVALGLNEALASRVLHLDIKPSNLMLAEKNRIKIVDFGLARANIEPGKPLEQIVGTPYYVAPEQIETGIVDQRSDIYSLGITFFQMLYGFVPFAGKTVQETFFKCLNGEFPAPESLDSSVPHELFEIILQMTARDPEHRYRKYSQLIKDLEGARRVHHTIAMPGVAHQIEPILRMAGSVHDRSFAEILGELETKGLCGKLTLRWVDVSKILHIKDGKIIAVLSNQEGENLLDSLVQSRRMSKNAAKKILSESSDIYQQYSSTCHQIAPETGVEFQKAIRDLAWRIVEGLFRWQVGDFAFEEGDFLAQSGLRISIRDLLLKGIKEWMPFDLIERRLPEDSSTIQLQPDSHQKLLTLQLQPADTFILFRFQEDISFEELHSLSAMPLEEFSRLIYLFYCLEIVHFQQRLKGNRSHLHHGENAVKCK